MTVIRARSKETRMYLELGTADGDIRIDEEALPTIADAKLTKLGISREEVHRCFEESRRLMQGYTDREKVRYATVTAVRDAPERPLPAPPEGAAYWSGTGPPGTVCEECHDFGCDPHYPRSCDLYYCLTGQKGAPLPISTPSCLHFRPRSR
jgi:hypothetical protein